MVCRPTGIRTPTDGTKNQSATVTPWVCLFWWRKTIKKYLIEKIIFAG